MGAYSLIEWCHHTFNAWIGCWKISPACQFCYAPHTTPVRRARADGTELWGRDADRLMLSDGYWRQPILWDRAAAAAGERHRVFVNSLADVAEDRPDLAGPRERLAATIQATPNLDYLWLTKRPEDLGRLASAAFGWDVMAHGFPPNVWAGTTVESRDYLWRVAELMEIPKTTLFISAEPLLEDLMEVGPGLGNLARFLHRDERRPGAAVECYPFDGVKAIPDHDWKSGRIRWVICGGESSKIASEAVRPMHPVWARSLRDECERSGVAYFFKQWGDHAPWDADQLSRATVAQLVESGKVSLGMRMMPDGTTPASGTRVGRAELDRYMAEGVHMVRVGKKAAGRLLDGRTWDEIPTPEVVLAS